MTPFDAAKANLARLGTAEKGPGCQYCLVDGDSVSCHAEGVADLRTGAPVTLWTTFNAFSVTKTFTSAAILRLAEAGRLGLDHPLGRYVAVPYRPEPTLRQILSHTAGLPNPMPMNWVHPAERHAGFDERRFIDSLVAGNPSLKRQPGERFAYSNLGYLLLGKAIENITGSRYADHIRDSLISRLGPGPDEYLGFSLPGGGRHALGAVRSWSVPRLLLPFLPAMAELRDTAAGGWIQLKPFQVDGSAYGGLIANAPGLARFLQAMMGTELLSGESLAQTFATQRDAKGPTPMTLGWFSGRLDGMPYFAHAGGGGGYYCEVRIYPGRGRASVFMSNRTGVRDERLLDRIDRGTGLESAREMQAESAASGAASGSGTGR